MGDDMFVIVMVVQTVLISAQIDPLEDRLKKEKDFLEPKQLSDNQDEFVFENKIKYFISSNELNWEDAKHSCMSLTGRIGMLAIIDTEEKANFLAEALTETSKPFDNLWISGRLHKNMSWTTGYVVNGQVTFLPQAFLDKYNGTANRSHFDMQRDCLSFRRSDHQNASFIDLNCFALRSYICQRTYEQVNDTSHSEWIQQEKRLYKIFHNQMSWENASISCFKMDKEARLAVITNYLVAQNLARHLLVMRPSLENAWIGAKWSHSYNSYVFKNEQLILPNKTDSSNYPPWRNSTIKTGGCLLLDRHMKKLTYFVEARCQRLRPYICYKQITKTRTDLNNTFIFPNRDYHIHFNKLRFVEAVAMCTYPVNGKNGILAQPKSQGAVNELLLVMGENSANVQHIWLGGKYFDGKWKWLKQKQNASQPDEGGDEIPAKLNEEYPPWVLNSTYVHVLENMYTCLNMDRENHLEAMFYGTDCYYSQSFICQYPSGTYAMSTNTETIPD